jgi:hypothetical protein
VKEEKTINKIPITREEFAKRSLLNSKMEVTEENIKLALK